MTFIHGMISTPLIEYVVAFIDVFTVEFPIEEDAGVRLKVDVEFATVIATDVKTTFAVVLLIEIEFIPMTALVVELLMLRVIGVVVTVDVELAILSDDEFLEELAIVFPMNRTEVLTVTLAPTVIPPFTLRLTKFDPISKYADPLDENILKSIRLSASSPVDIYEEFALYDPAVVLGVFPVVEVRFI
jgi:hypothetical protein